MSFRRPSTLLLFSFDLLKCFSYVCNFRLPWGCPRSHNSRIAHIILGSLTYRMYLLKRTRLLLSFHHVMYETPSLPLYWRSHLVAPKFKCDRHSNMQSQEANVSDLPNCTHPHNINVDVCHTIKVSLLSNMPSHVSFYFGNQSSHIDFDVGYVFALGRHILKPEHSPFLLRQLRSFWSDTEGTCLLQLQPSSYTAGIFFNTTRSVINLSHTIPSSSVSSLTGRESM